MNQICLDDVNYLNANSAMGIITHEDIKELLSYNCCVALLVSRCVRKKGIRETLVIYGNRHCVKLPCAPCELIAKIARYFLSDIKVINEETRRFVKSLGSTQTRNFPLYIRSWLFFVQIHIHSGVALDGQSYYNYLFFHGTVNHLMTGRLGLEVVYDGKQAQFLAKRHQCVKIYDAFCGREGCVYVPPKWLVMVGAGLVFY